MYLCLVCWHLNELIDYSIYTYSYITCNVRYDSSWNIVNIGIDYLETPSCKRNATMTCNDTWNDAISLLVYEGHFGTLHKVLLLKDEKVYIYAQCMCYPNNPMVISISNTLFRRILCSLLRTRKSTSLLNLGHHNDILTYDYLRANVWRIFVRPNFKIFIRTYLYLRQCHLHDLGLIPMVKQS